MPRLPAAFWSRKLANLRQRRASERSPVAGPRRGGTPWLSGSFSGSLPCKVRVGGPLRPDGSAAVQPPSHATGDPASIRMGCRLAGLLGSGLMGEGGRLCCDASADNARCRPDRHNQYHTCAMRCDAGMAWRAMAWQRRTTAAARPRKRQRASSSSPVHAGPASCWHWPAVLWRSLCSAKSSSSVVVFSSQIHRPTARRAYGAWSTLHRRTWGTRHGAWGPGPPALSSCFPGCVWIVASHGGSIPGRCIGLAWMPVRIRPSKSPLQGSNFICQPSLIH